MKYHNVACSGKDDEADSSAGKKISLKKIKARLQRLSEAKIMLLQNLEEQTKDLNIQELLLKLKVI